MSLRTERLTVDGGDVLVIWSYNPDENFRALTWKFEYNNDI